MQNVNLIKFIFMLLLTQTFCYQIRLKIRFPDLSPQFFNIAWNNSHSILSPLKHSTEFISNLQCWNSSEYLSIPNENITVYLLICREQNHFIILGYESVLKKLYSAQVNCSDLFDKSCNGNQLLTSFIQSTDYSIIQRLISSEINLESKQTISSKCSNNSECISGPCCNTTTCRFLPAYYVCRASSDCCDVAENCSGESAVCPEDDYFRDGTPCNSEKTYKGLCHRGQCYSIQNECRRLHPLMRKGLKNCYEQSQCLGIYCLVPSNLLSARKIRKLEIDSTSNRSCTLLPNSTALCETAFCSKRECKSNNSCKHCATNQHCTLKNKCLLQICAKNSFFTSSILFLLPIFFFSIFIFILPYFHWLMTRRRAYELILSKIGSNIFVLGDNIDHQNFHNSKDLIYNDQSLIEARHTSFQNVPNDENSQKQLTNDKPLANPSQLTMPITMPIETSIKPNHTESNFKTFNQKDELELLLLGMIKKIYLNIQYGKSFKKILERPCGSKENNSTNSHPKSSENLGIDILCPNKIGNIDEIKYYEIQVNEKLESSTPPPQVEIKPNPKPNPKPKVKKSSKTRPSNEKGRSSTVTNDSDKLLSNVSKARNNSFEKNLFRVMNNVITANIIHEGSEIIESTDYSNSKLNNHSLTKTRKVTDSVSQSRKIRKINATQNNMMRDTYKKCWEYSSSECSDCERIFELKDKLFKMNNDVTKYQELLVITDQLHSSHHLKSSGFKAKEDSEMLTSQGISGTDIKNAWRMKEKDQKNGKLTKPLKSDSSDCSDCLRLLNLANHRKQIAQEGTEEYQKLDELLKNTIIIHLAHHNYLNVPKRTSVLMQNLYDLVNIKNTDQKQDLNSIDETITKEASEILYSARKDHGFKVSSKHAESMNLKRNSESLPFTSKSSETMPLPLSFEETNEKLEASNFNIPFRDSDEGAFKKVKNFYKIPKINESPLMKNPCIDKKNSKFLGKKRENYKTSDPSVSECLEDDEYRESYSMDSDSVPKCPVHNIPMKLVATVNYNEKIKSPYVKKITRNKKNKPLIKSGKTNKRNLNRSRSNQEDLQLNEIENSEYSNGNIVVKTEAELIHKSPHGRFKKQESDLSLMGRFREYELNKGLNKGLKKGNKKKSQDRVIMGKYIYKGARCPTCDIHVKKTDNVSRMANKKGLLSSFPWQCDRCSYGDQGESRYLRERKLSPTSFIPCFHHMKCCSSCNDLYTRKK